MNKLLLIPVLILASCSKNDKPQLKLKVNMTLNTIVGGDVTVEGASLIKRYPSPGNNETYEMLDYNEYDNFTSEYSIGDTIEYIYRKPRNSSYDTKGTVMYIAKQVKTIDSKVEFSVVHTIKEEPSYIPDNDYENNGHSHIVFLKGIHFRAVVTPDLQIRKIK